MLTPDQKRRYARHLVLPEIGEAGQEKLLQSKILVVGAGGLGAAAIGYAASMGIGTIGVVDHDRVEVSNLQRQILYETADIGRYKVEVVRDRIEEINPDVKIIPYKERFEEVKWDDEWHTLLDCTDNFATRFAVQETALRLRAPLISAAISGFSAQISTFKPHLGAPHPCYRCLVSDTPSREMACAQEGIIGALAGVLGSLQALEAVKELLGLGRSLSGSLLAYDALSADWKKTKLMRDPSCQSCSGSL